MSSLFLVFGRMNVGIIDELGFDIQSVVLREVKVAIHILVGCGEVRVKVYHGGS